MGQPDMKYIRGQQKMHKVDLSRKSKEPSMEMAGFLKSMKLSKFKTFNLK